MAGCFALIVAAGRGQRFGGGVPKQYRPLAGRPLLRHSVESFARHPGIDGVRAVIHPDDRALYAAAVEGLEVLEPVPGGACRQESARLGLESLGSEEPDLVLIHDGARPFVDADTISRTIAALEGSPAAVAASCSGTDAIHQNRSARAAHSRARQSFITTCQSRPLSAGSP